MVLASYLSHISTSSISTCSNSFVLKDIFYIPHISKNLLSVSKFTSDNDAFFEFHPTLLVVKDRCTGSVVLQGPNKYGLYCLDQSMYSRRSEPSAFISERITMDVWHQRLGHPMLRTVTAIVASHFLPVSNKGFEFSQSCQMTKSHRLHFPSSTIVYNKPRELILSDM